MKKLLLLLIALTPLLTNAQFKQAFGLEYYISNSTKSTVESNEIIFNKGDFATLYFMSYKYKSFKAESLTSIYMDKSKSYMFSPTHSEFTISLYYKVRKLTIKAEHQCVHPIITESDKYRSKMYGGHTKICIYYNFN